MSLKMSRVIWALGWLGCPIPKEEEPERTCEDAEVDLRNELAVIQTCEQDSECGTVLVGTSCGCTRDLVARRDAETEAFYGALEEVQEMECDAGLSSVCDCPETAGFRCDDGTCAHNYIDDYPYLPVCHAADGDMLTVDAASIEGDELIVTVSYGGGCETHDIDLCWPDQSFMESYPVQVQLELLHDGHDDACDAYLTEDRRFSLSPLAQAYRDAYGGAGTVTIHVHGFDLDYTFE